MVSHTCVFLQIPRPLEMPRVHTGADEEGLARAVARKKATGYNLFLKETRGIVKEQASVAATRGCKHAQREQGQEWLQP